MDDGPYPHKVGYVLTAHVVPDEIGGFSVLQVMQWEDEQIDEKRPIVRSFVRPLVKAPWRR